MCKEKEGWCDWTMVGKQGQEWKKQEVLIGTWLHGVEARIGNQLKGCILGNYVIIM